MARAAGVPEDLYIAYVGGKPRDLFLHECTSYAVARGDTDGKAIFFHKTRDNVDREQAAYILESSVRGDSQVHGRLRRQRHKLLDDGQ